MLRKLRLATLVVLGFAALGFGGVSDLLAQKIIRVPSLTAATIQGGIDLANDGDTVLVGAQMLNAPYTEHIDFKGKAITVSSVAAGIVIDGTGLPGATVTFQSHETRNSVLSGFTITGGSNGGAGYGQADGGIFVLNASPTISSNDITANHAHGIRVTQGAPLIQSNTIEGTLSDSLSPLAAGAGIYLEELTTGCSATAPTLATCVAILNNMISTNTGGAIVIDSTNNAYIEQNTVQANTRAGDGAALYMTNAIAVNVVDNLIYNNNTTTGGTGGLYFLPPFSGAGPFAIIVSNNTLANNTTSAPSNLAGSQLNFASRGSISLAVNNVFAGNTASSPVVSCGTVVAGDTPATFDHNDIYNSASGSTTNYGCDIPAGQYGSLTANPNFASAATGNYASSAGVDKGNSSTPILLASDINGARVPQDTTGLGYGVVDIGAYEATGSIYVHILQGTLTVTPSAYVQTGTTPITLTATMVSPTDVPAGLVDFYIDNVLTKSVALDSTGTASITTADVPAGTHAVLAVYPMSSTYANSPTQSVKFYIQINAVVPGVATTTAVTSSMNPSGFGAPIVFTATVTAASGAPVGSVAFYNGAALLGTVLLTPGTGTVSTAQINNNTLTVGNHVITATFIPGGNFTTSAGTLSGGQTITAVHAVTLTETSSVNPSAVAQPVMFTAKVKSVNAADGIPTGAVTFYDSQTAITGAQHLPLDTTGAASFTTATLTHNSNPGHQINAIFEPTNAYGQAQSSVTQIVNGTATSTTVIATNDPPPAATVTLTVTVTALAPNANPITGTVVCYVDNQTIPYSGTIANGQTTISIPPQQTGNHTYTCNYSGDTYYNASGGSAVGSTTSVIATTLTLTSSANPTPALSPVTFTATLLDPAGKAVAGASVTLTIDTTTVTLLTSATGVVTTTATFAVGAHTIAATYAGDQTYGGSSAHLTETAFVNATTLGLVLAPNPGYQNTPITFAVTVVPTTGSAVPYGTVTILDGTTTIAMLPIAAGAPNGSVSTGISTLAVGTHSITATFTPADANFLASATTPAQTLTILPQTFTLAISTPSITIETQHHAALTVSLASVGNWTGFVQLSCGNLPAVLKCEYKDQQLALQPNGKPSTTLTLETDAIDNFENQRGGLMAGVLLLPLALLGFTRKRRLSRAIALSTLFALLSTLYLSGCTSKIPDHTPPGTYQILVTGTGSPLGTANVTTQTATLTVVITP